MVFTPSHSPLAKNQDILMSYINILGKKLGNEIKIIGIIEFGSYAKEEAVHCSDIDTRVYVTCQDHYVWQPVVARFSQRQKNILEQRFLDFKKKYGALPKKEYDWWTFNNPLAEKINDHLGINIEFGLSDYQYTMFELQRLNSFVTTEHAILLQSNILYDPRGLVARMQNNIRDKFFKPLATFYQKRYLDALPFEIYQHLESDKNDDFKIRKSKQIQWIKWAVRCFRDAVASKTYIASGNFIYKKPDVLDFYKRHIPEDYELVQQIYTWKTDEKTRKKMVNDFLRNKEYYFQLFNSLMPRLESVIKKVNKIKILA